MLSGPPLALAIGDMHRVDGLFHSPLLEGLRLGSQLPAWTYIVVCRSMLLLACVQSTLRGSGASQGCSRQLVRF
jgi:hypothetical protein